MKVAVPKETRPGELRVALVPQGVKTLTKAGLEVAVEAGAGRASGVADDEYAAASAKVVPTAAAALLGAGMVLRIAGGFAAAPIPADVHHRGGHDPARKGTHPRGGSGGLQAITTARRLGAVVEAFDVRPAVKEQVQSLGAKFLESDHAVTAEGEGGYAKELSEDQHKRELALIAGAITNADVVIATAQIPGARAPILITEEMVKSMRPGSVIVDLAAETGGNCALTKSGETVSANGVQIAGPVNFAATIPVHASQMYSKNVVTLVSELVGKDGQVALDMANDVVGPATLTHAGEVRNERVRQALGG